MNWRAFQGVKIINQPVSKHIPRDHLRGSKEKKLHLRAVFRQIHI